MEIRKQEILKATIDNYIETAEPVGTKLLSEHESFDVSPATVRSELNNLEKEGYLTQIHTSSGRVPTDKGYRYYVDTLMKRDDISLEQQKSIINKLSLIGSDINEVLTEITSVMSSVINYTTIVITPDIYEETLKLAHLVLVDIDRILVVLMDTIGVNTEFLIRINHKIDQDDLNKISKLLTEKLGGKTITDVSHAIAAELISELPHFNVILKKLGEELKKVKAKSSSKSRQLMTGGVSKMLNLPEFKNVELTQKVIATLEENKVLLGVLSEYLNQQEEQVVIGEECKVANLKECSVVIAPYKVQNQSVGAIGILGPKRMAYSSIVPLVKNVSGLINDYLDKEQ